MGRRPAGGWSNTWGDGAEAGPVSPPVDAAELRAALDAAMARGSTGGSRIGAGRTRRGSGERGSGVREPGAGHPVDDDVTDDDPGDGAPGDTDSGEYERAAGRRSEGGRGRRDKRDRAGTRGRARRGADDADAGPEAPADPEATARAICLRLLTGRARTRSQLADALRRREVPDDVAEHVLGRFTDVGLIDDTAFADAWVNTRHTGKGLAGRALARELRQRGVDAVVVDEAVARLDPEQELETARALVARRLPGTRGLDRDKRIRRLAGMLARKGYGEGLAVRVVRDALAQEAESDTEGDEDATPWGAWDGPA
ncbi:regulatory protein RecX [Embleya sp. NBC_00896]|uniref:regulatory protein RecX n=1 Tax=Embleya sp. NBC_00896 TaxID=2975961 RepID=UPI0038664A48|nr:recombination regulator RecX [Embleya sp. NBC_00896]